MPNRASGIALIYMHMPKDIDHELAGLTRS